MDANVHNFNNTVSRFIYCQTGIQTIIIKFRIQEVDYTNNQYIHIANRMDTSAERKKGKGKIIVKIECANVEQKRKS